MAIDLSSEATRQDFVKARKLSERIHEDLMSRRTQIMAKLIGDNWTLSNKKETITNLLFRAYETFSFDLSSNRPRCKISSRVRQNGWFAANFQTALNNYSKKISFDAELLACVQDAILGMGVMKRYWAPSGEEIEVLNPDVMEPGIDAGPDEWRDYSEMQYLKVDPGQPMLERVDPYDFIWDTAQPRRRYFRYECHRYRRALSDVKSDRRYDASVREALQASSKFGANAEERAQRLGELGYQHDLDELEPMVTLWDVYLPQEKKFYVLADDASLAPLYSGKWNGAPGGPFSLLIFSQAPDNFTPISLLANLETIHDNVNSTLRKMIRQAQRQKEYLAYSGPEGDAIRAGDVSDGGRIRISSPESIQMMKSGGVNPLLAQFNATLQQLGNREGGNIDLIAGIAPQAATARQDELLHERNGIMQNHRVQNVAQFTGECFEALAWMMWNDVNLEVRGQREIPGLDIKVDATWKPDVRAGDIEDYEFEFTPFNQSFIAPSDKMAMINGLLTNFYLPLLPALNQAGLTLDLSGMPEFHATMGNAPELRQFIVPMTTPPGGGQNMGGSGQSSQPASPVGQPLPVSQRTQDPQRTYRHTSESVTPHEDPNTAAWASMAEQGA